MTTLSNLVTLLQPICTGQRLQDLEKLIQDHPDEMTEDKLVHLQGVLEILLSVTQDDEVLLATIVLFLFRTEVVTDEEISERWGSVVWGLVKGTMQLDVVSEINPEYVAQHERHKESLRKMLLSLSKDIRVVFIKLAHRLYLMRQLKNYEPGIQQIVAQETRDVFAPLANRLGIWILKWELEDLSFRYLEYDAYRMLAKKLDRKRTERVAYIEQVKEALSTELEAHQIHVEVSGRSKHIYSIWRKMQLKDLTFEQLFDLRAVRVLTNTVAECYSVLGVVHNLWTPIPKEFDDYISNPKSNNYRSLHTAVRATNGHVVEVQIRTHEMHDFAESGVAAHWRYKEKSKYDENFESKVKWLRQLLNWKQETDDEQLDQFEEALSESHIYVLSPQDEVVELPEGSTALDFSYHIHTDLGHRTRGAKVDGRILPLTEPLQTMQKVEILTTKEIKPSRDWMNASQGYLKTSSARAKVKTWFKKQGYEENHALGKSLLKKEAKRLHVEPDMESLVVKLKKKNEEMLLISIGSGEVSVPQLISALDVMLKKEDEPTVKKAKEQPTGKSIVEIEGVEGLLTQIASCCHPVLGDKIVGYITQGRGVSVHRSDCSEVLYLEEEHPNRIIDINWLNNAEAHYSVDILIKAYVRDTLLKDLTLFCANEKVAVLGMVTKMNRSADVNKIQMSLEVKSINQLSDILGKMEKIHNIISVARL